MFALLLALAPAAMARESSFVPGFDDPILYPPEALPDEEVVGGALRVEGGGAMVLEYTDVVAEVHAGLARVTLTQFFANPYDQAIEATYLLPLPSQAAVNRMDLVVGDRLVEGVVMERGAAREAYEDARDEGRKAALLEQQRDNLFTQQVAGICPGERVVVTIEYIEQLELEDGLTTFALPTTVGPRFSPPWVADAEALVTPYARTGRRVDVTVHIEEGMPVETLFSDSHAIEVVAEDDRGLTVTLAEGEDVPDRDVSITWSLAGTQPRGAALVHRPAGEDGYIAVTLEPQLLDDHFEARPRELLFVIDSSGSMAGEPYETARAAVLLALARARPGDTFNLLRFSNDSEALFALPQPVTRANREAAAAWLSRFTGGGTQMEKGLVHALTSPGDPEALRLVLMLTDGYVGHESQLFGLVRQHLGRARLFSLGVGASVNRYLLEGLAEMGRGDVIYKLPGTPLAAAVDTFNARIAHPAMSDIRLDFGAAKVYGQYPQRVPDLWAGQPLRVVARFEGEAPRSVRVTGRVGRAPFELELPLEAGEVEPAHGAVATLWARRRIRDIEWYPRGRSAEAQREEILAVALEHHLVSRYTSLVALDEEPCPCGAPTRRVQVPHEGVAGLSPSGLGSPGTVGRGSVGSGFGGGSGIGLGGGGVAYGVAGLTGSKAVVTGAGGLGLRGAGVGGGGAIPDVRAASERSRAPSVTGATPIVLGAIDRRTIQDEIDRHRIELRHAYDRALGRDPTLSGRLEVKFVISPDGRVLEATVTDRGLGDARFIEDVRAVFLGLAFPAVPGGGVVIVRYPLAFSP